MPRALLSTTDKAGLVEFGAGLIELGVELVATGGTARTLRDAGLTVLEVSSVTGFEEILGGRVKTLHPAIHAGILADLRIEDHRNTLVRMGLEPFAVVCVNLYDFERTVLAPHDFADAVESIDIGGPAMIRAAAKNHANVLVVVDPSDYGEVLVALRDGTESSLGPRLAAKAFRHTAYYDAVIAGYMSRAAADTPFPEKLAVGLRKAEGKLRYGENPQQRASLYRSPLREAEALRPDGAAAKETSYNYWLDAVAAWRLALDLGEGSCVIVKHGNPCGAAVAPHASDAYRAAKAGDPVSAFGGIVAMNGPIDAGAVEAMTERGNFLEVVVSRGWEAEELRSSFHGGGEWTRNVRFLIGTDRIRIQDPSLTPILGGFLAQDEDGDPGHAEWRVMTERAPTDLEFAALKFAWRVVAHVKSNAIVVSTADRLLGVGAGQMNRVQSVRLALEQAGSRASGAALASDAFFPFADSVSAAAAAGVGSIVQPGGSKRDREVIAAANELGVPMVFTGVRHFRHQ